MLRRFIPWVALVAGVAMLTYLVALYATPGFVMRGAMSRLADAGEGRNAMTHAPLATADARAIVRPSPDLAYSSCPFDLGDGAVTVTVPPIDAPYWSLAVYDGNTDTAFVRNDREVRGQPVNIAIARQGQTIPAGFVPVWVNARRGVALLRVLVPDRANFAPIDQARRAATCGAAAGG